MNDDSISPEMVSSIFKKFFQRIPQRLLADMIVEKCSNRGMEMSGEKANMIAENMVIVDENDLVQGFHAPGVWAMVRLNLVLSEQDFIEKLDAKALEFKNLIPAEIERLSDQTAEDLIRFAEKRWNVASREMENEMRDLREGLYKMWNDPIEKFRMLRAICFEFGSEYGRELTKKPPEGKESLREVMVVSHTRACQIASEILYLIEGGFADGAMARCRSLHEIAVISMFISLHGEEVARRFLAHRVVDLMRDERNYRNFLRSSGHEIGEYIDNEISREYQRVINEFGKGFESAYGWAAECLGNRRPRFSDIERSTFRGLGDGMNNNMRIFYRMSSQSIHVGSRNLYSRHGLPGNEPMLLAGPSNIGFSDPGRWAAISLAMVTNNLFAVREPHPGEMQGEAEFCFSVAHSVVMRCMYNAINSFDETHNKLEIEESRLDNGDG